MSGYVPNNRHIRKAPEPEPYNGNFDQQARRPMQTPPASASQRMVGMRFIWDNGELLPPNIPYLLTADQGSPIRGDLDDRGSFIQQLQANHYEARLLADVDVDAAVASARSEMQAALDEILAAERAEAKQLRKEQDGRNLVVNYFHVRFAFGKGFFLGAWGMIKSFKEMSDLINPFNTAWNMLASAWKAKATPQEGWYANFLNNYSAAQHEELVEALGFDPASITREMIAEAYEIACFIYEDGPSKDMLGRFAVDYAKAQNVEEIAEFSGGAAFELVLAALLFVFTGGAAVVARGATSLRHAASLKRLGNALQRLSRTLKNLKIKRKGYGKGQGTGAQTVEVPRPKEIKAEVPLPKRKELKIEQFTAPTTGKVINAAVEGKAIVPLDKVTLYARGKVPDVREEHKALKNLKQTNRKLFDADPNNANLLVRLGEQEHNLVRSSDMKRHLQDIGLDDTPENNQVIIEHLLEVGQQATPDNRLWLPSLLEGPNGLLQVESTWAILGDGRAYLTTLKLMPAKKR